MLKEITDKPTIFTLRSPKEGGNMNIDDTERLKYIRYAIQLNFRYVDIELYMMHNHLVHYHLRGDHTVCGLLGGVKNTDSSSQIIISYHNSSSSENLRSLRAIRDAMIASKADICKIAVASDGKVMNNTILKLIEETKRMNIPIIAIAMGEKGKAVRIEGMREGNYMTYASLNNQKKTAIGQFTIKKINELTD